MKIILAVTNTRGKNLVFVSDFLKTLSLDEAIRAADKGLLQNVYSVNKTSGAYLRSAPNVSEYVVAPKHNIRFAAAYMRDIINVWAKYINLTKRPEIIATLYSKGYGDPKSNPVSKKRGEQIATEFYQLAKKWIK